VVTKFKTIDTAEQKKVNGMPNHVTDGGLENGFEMEEQEKQKIFSLF